MILSPKMKHCLDVIVRFQRDKGISPTYREIQREMGLNSPSQIVRLVDCLVERGYVRRIKRPGETHRGARTLMALFDSERQVDWESIAYAIIAEAKEMRGVLEAHNLPAPKKSFEY